MGINHSKPAGQVAAEGDQKIDTSVESLNRTPTPQDSAIEKTAVSVVLPLDAFQDELGQKMTGFQSEKDAWEQQLKEVMGNFRTESPRVHDGYKAFLTELDPTRVDYTQPIAQWFKENILNAITLEIEPANVALDNLIEKFEAEIKPLNDKLREAETNLIGWYKDKSEGKILEPIFKEQICSYAIQILDIEIAMLDAIKLHLDHCIGWENVTVVVLDLLLQALNLSTTKFVLPNFDFSAVVDKAYKASLNAKITSEEAAVETFVAETEGSLAHAKALMMPAAVVSPSPAPSPKQTQSQEQPLALDDAAKSALLDTAGQFTRRKSSPRPASVIAPKPVHPPGSPCFDM